MFNSPLFPTGNNNQLKQSNNQNRQKKEQKPRSRLKTVSMIIVATGFMFYPFFIIGGFFFFLYKVIDKEFRKKNIANMSYVTPFEHHFPIVILISIVLQLLNIWLFIMVIPRGYFSTYLYFPLNLLSTTLVVNHQTIIALILGSIGASSWMVTASVALDKRKVVSKEEKMNQVKQSKAYKKRQENKFNLAKEEAERNKLEYWKAKNTNDLLRLEELKQVVYLGTDEFGFPYYMTFKELNQHLLAVGTTGSGKTTLLQIFIEHCVKFDIPLLLFDGKGAKDTRNAIEQIAKMYHKETKAFVDNGDISYNPVKYGNSVEVKDRLVELAKTESVFYSGASELLLMNTVQLLDHFNINRTLKTLSTYFLPRNVLLLFADELLEKKPDLFTFTVESKEKKKPKKKKNTKKEDPETAQLDDDIQQLEEEPVAIEQEETITIDPETADLETVHIVLDRSKYLLSEGSLRLFNLLFTRYEHKKNVFYLYATSESLQTNFNILLDSEIAKLFDTEANKNELDLLEATREGEIMYVALDGLVYTKFIRTLAQFFISDINHLASERYEMTEDFPFAVLFDEPSAYLSFTFIDTVNKTRGAGVHALFSPQTLADIEAIDPILLKQLIGNVNTYMVGQTNEPTEVDYWSSLFGTFEDIELTEMTEQEDGYSDVNKTDWVAERGTRRNVNKFNVKPDDIKKLRKGEYIIYRKGDDVQEPIVKVFMRKVS